VITLQLPSLTIIVCHALAIALLPLTLIRLTPKRKAHCE
jgi:hypothetical protein